MRTSIRPRRSLEPTRPRGDDPLPAAAADAFRPGDVLSDTYEIRSLIGEGGMGQVYEAWDRRLERLVAVKADLRQPGDGALRQEARALAAFRHPSLVMVHALGAHEGRDYLVMERVHGASLAAHMRERAASGARFTVEDALGILVPVAEALGALHRGGVAHCDVKPSNVMIASDGRVLLMDFGLVVPEFDVAPDAVLAGSPSYMAPENVLEGLAAGAGHLADLYSFGVVAYELLAGEVPYSAHGVLEVLAKHACAPIPDLRAARPDVPESLAALVTDLLSKSPVDRPQHADEVIWRLSAVRRDLQTPRRARRFAAIVATGDRAAARTVVAWVRSGAPEADVRIVADADQAIDEARRARPDAVVVDAALPGADLLELCMVVRGEEPAPAVFAIGEGLAEGDLDLLRRIGVEHVRPGGAGDVLPAAVRRLAARRA